MSKEKIMAAGRPRPLTAKQRAELKALAALPETEIDTSEIPELTEKFWANAKQGRFTRPLKNGR